ncbi:MAG: hypothetical protein ACYS21_18175 [Planctomycetota bacterium]|jgi:hypothetical protein
MTERTNTVTFLVLFQFSALILVGVAWAAPDKFDEIALNNVAYDSSGYEYGADFYLADGNYIVVDDMESYNDSNNYIWVTWWDGCEHPTSGGGSNGTRSCIELAIDPCDPVHGGTQSMEYAYDNREYGDRCPDYSEVIRQYDPPVDWNTHGEKALVLWFRGAAGNGITPMWVVLNWYAPPIATYGDNGEDPEDIKKDEWMEWNIKLSDFADGGVDLENVTDISIGFGDKFNGEPDETTGTVYFDDIRLYPPRCVERFAPAADFTGDCLVYWQDLEIMAQQWLYTGEGAAQGNIANYDATNPGATTVYAASDCNEYQASGPSPADGETAVKSAITEVVLEWIPSCDVAGCSMCRHFVFFGTDKQAVEDAPIYEFGWVPGGPGVPPEYKGWVPGTLTEFNIGNLPLWSTFHWRIDEGPIGPIVKGNVWSFTTGCDLVVSDLNIDCLVNLEDYTVLAGSWLEQAPLWPPE